jgi:hypothetical protein
MESRYWSSEPAQSFKHKAMSYGRMKEKESQLRQEVRALLKRADRIVSREAKLYRRNRRGNELPEDLRHRESRFAKVREAKRPLEEEARQKAQAEGKDSEAAKQSMDAYSVTEKQEHNPRLEKSKPRPLLASATLVDWMRRKLQTKSGSAIYEARKSIEEPEFGQIKQGRGFRQFLLRGLEKVKPEWALVCLTHNILKMCRICHG